MVTILKSIKNRRTAGYLIFAVSFSFFMARAGFEMICDFNGLTVKNLLVSAAYKTHMTAMNYIDGEALQKEKQGDKKAASHLSRR